MTDDVTISIPLSIPKEKEHTEELYFQLSKLCKKKHHWITKF